MAKTTLIHGHAADHGRACEMIMTDPPFELAGGELAGILGKYDAPHLVMITTMRQLLDFLPHTDWRLSFDFVIDGVRPKKSLSYRLPNYTHQTGVYLTRPGVKSAFDRRRRQRSDTFEANGYWPTIFHAPRDRGDEHAKNTTAMTDLLGSFSVKAVCDPFAGSGTTGFAAADLDIEATLIEIDAEKVASMRKSFRFLGIPLHEQEKESK